ncbi:PREDICTED: thioredoxin-2 [Rhagoletis zephyria]|uniref:thioredoxin-2 n=1 Tax=Rhagoletis zephyria TaxID=28612 RepID=UPI000811A745|nr:PREDICTED: thioredoxin-2 [Rhagoletis zephyria]
MMHTVRSNADFDRQLSAAGGRLVVVDFTASWCGPCKCIEPKVRALSKKYKDRAVVLKVDVDKCSNVAHDYRVSCMPTFVFIRNGRKIDRLSGADERELEYKMSKMARAK